MNQMDRKLDRYIFLLGRPPFEEYLGVLNAQYNFDPAKISEYVNDWRKAEVLLQELQKSEAGHADKPGYQDVPEQLLSLVRQVLLDPVFERAFNVVKPVIRMVELDSLIVYQKDINLDYAESIKAQLAEKPNDEDVFRLCIPVEHELPPISVSRVSNDSFMFVSPSTDLRILETSILPQSVLGDMKFAGSAHSAVGLVVGTGPNCLTTLLVNGRMVLRNGSHRAYALKSMGYTHAPAMVLQVSSRQELNLLAPEIMLRQLPLFLEAPRPPLLKDYFNDSLTSLLEVVKRNRQIKVSFKVEVFDVPVI